VRVQLDSRGLFEVGQRVEVCLDTAAASVFNL
jgi:hypothetical protein